jgi:predicted MFS family arabinose efflux permease
MVAVTSAPLGLVTVAALSGAGTLAFAASARSAERPGGGERRGTRSVLTIGRMRALVTVAVLLGALFGGLEVGIPTLATAHGAPAAAGLLVAMFSVGGVLGALIYGARRWTAQPSIRLAALAALACLASSAMIAAEGLPAVGALMLLTGVAINPALTTLSLLVDRVSAERTAAEAFGWLSTGFSVGTGAASAIAGAVIRHGHSARPAFILAGVAAAGATVVALMVRGS